MGRVLPLLLALVLPGCTTGYLADYLVPKASLVAPQLARYGIANAPCVERRLAERLTTWQLRQLGDLAGRLVPGGRNPATLGAWEFTYIAGLVEDQRVGPLVRRTFADCGVEVARSLPVAAAAATPVVGTPADAGAAVLPPPSSAPAALPASVPSLWVNLGSARTGQGIAVDAASVTRAAGWRQAWFRLIDMAGGSSDLGYLLRIDCAARTITAHAGRKYAADGTLAEQKDYAAPEGPMGIEPGTVMDVAFQSLCAAPG